MFPFSLLSKEHESQETMKQALSIPPLLISQLCTTIIARSRRAEALQPVASWTATSKDVSCRAKNTFK